MALSATSPDLTDSPPTAAPPRRARRRHTSAAALLAIAVQAGACVSARAENLCALVPARHVGQSVGAGTEDPSAPRSAGGGALDPGGGGTGAAGGPSVAASPSASPSPPSPLLLPADLERQGAVIGTIRFRTVDVFDPTIPEEDRFFFRLVNRLHVRTREQTVRHQLLFAEGEPFIAHRLEETERNLRALPYVQEASVVAESVDAEGRVSVLVTTRDQWSTGASVRFGVSGGKSTGGVSLSEGNLFGRGKHLEFDVRNGLDRTTEDLTYDDLNLFGTRLVLSAGHRQATDGRGNAFAMGLPFYSLETRLSWGTDLRHNLDQYSYRQEGETIQRFDHDLTDLTATIGFSDGLVGGVTTRWTVGYEVQDDLFEPDGRLPDGYPSEAIPASRTVSGPTIQFTNIRSDFIKVKYFERFSRYEDFNLGHEVDLRMHFSPRAFGASRSEVLYDFSGSVGYRIRTHGYLLAEAGLTGRLGGNRETLLHFKASHYYVRWPRQTFVTQLSADAGSNLDATQRLFLGGDSGLRGFGVRRFDGERRFLLNVEDRIHTDRQIFRLLQFGAAAFLDVGNAWGGLRVSERCRRVRFAPGGAGGVIDPDLNTPTRCRAIVEENSFGHLKADVGISLLADVVRASQTRFVRLNIAYPLNGESYDQATILLSVGKEGGF